MILSIKGRKTRERKRERWDKAGTEEGSPSFHFPAVLILELPQIPCTPEKREQRMVSHRELYFQVLPSEKFKLYILILMIFVKRKMLSNPTHSSPNQSAWTWGSR